MTRSAPLSATVDALRRGGVVAYPTEAVWGLGCDPFNEQAVMRLLAIKQRPVDKGLILIGADVGQLDPVVDWAALPMDRRATVEASWPGPNTWTVPVTGGLFLTARSRRILNYRSRLQGANVWATLGFLLNGLVFNFPSYCCE